MRRRRQFVPDFWWRHSDTGTKPHAYCAPTPTYTAFDDLTGDHEFNTACSIRPGFGGANGGITTFSDFFTFAFTEATETWRIAGPTLDDNFDSSFGPGDISDEVEGEFIVYRREIQINGNPAPEIFAVITPQITGGTTTYVRGGDAILFGTNNLQQRFYRCVFGVPTRVDDALPNATITFANEMQANGTATLINSAGGSTPFRLDRAEIAVTANPQNGEIELTLSLLGREVSSDPVTGDPVVSDTVTDLGTFTGTTSVTEGVQGFEGALVDSDQLFAGEFSGWFFGPSGAELGLALYGREARNDGSTVEFALSMAGPQD